MKIRILSTGMAVATAIFTVSELGAFPVGSNDVVRAIGNWRHRRGTLGAKLGEKVRDLRKVEWKDVSFHVVRFEGGGYLIASTDTRLRPVVMFSGADDIDLDERNPALALIAADIGGESARAGIGEDMDAGASNASSAAAPRSRNEREWAELLDDDEYDWRDDLEDVCVGPLVQTKWSQREDESGKTCYSWYTPNGWYCGCVATALAQVMKYFEWPKVDVAQFTSDWTMVDGVATNMTTQGGAFDWANMPLRPGAGTTDDQRKAIGKLTSDVGILAGMNYREGGSGSYTRLGRYVLTKTVLGYSNAMMSYMSGHRDGTEDDFKRVMISNFNAKRPVTLGIDGHSIVGDGYGYNGGTLYYHLNMGWAGSWDLWYSVPLSDSDKIADKYTYFNAVIYNIYTTEDPSLVILSGRVKDKAAGGAVPNQRVVAYAADGTEVEDATTDEHGIYSMLVLPGEYIVEACDEAQDRRSAYFGSAVGNALRCVTMENNGRNGYYSPYGDKEMGNCADCDIAMEMVEYKPEAEVAVGEVSVGTDFAEAVVPVTAKVVHYGQTATSAKVVVMLTPVGGGVVQTKKFAIDGDFDAHAFIAAFEGLTAGGRYEVSAKVVMNTAEESGLLDDGSFAAAREFIWFDESATSFSAAKWSGVGTTVKVQDGNLSIVNVKDGETTFTPESKDVCASRVVIKVWECGCYAADKIPDPNGPAAITAINGTGGMFELVIWGNGKWNKTGIKFTEETANVDVTVDLDFQRHFVQYSVENRSLGTYSIPNTVSTVSSVAFKGYVVVSELGGTGWDANLVKDANGTEYATVTAAKADKATEPLEPLWKSTWPVGETAGSFEAKDPNGLITPANGMTVVKRVDKGNDVFENWYAKADPSDIGAGGHAEKYIETTVQFGLAKAITDDSVVKIDGFAVAEGSMTFKVKVGEEEVAKDAITSKVEVSEAVDTGWRKPDPETGEIVFDEANHEITVTPKSKDDPAQKPGMSFVRVRIPIDEE